MFTQAKLFHKAGEGGGGGGGDQHNLGWYATESALTTAHPTATNGDWAIVGATDTVWVWDSDTTAWVDTDTKGQVTSVNGATGAVTIGANDVLPSQTGNSGKFLTTDGTDASWSDKPLVNKSTALYNGGLAIMGASAGKNCVAIGPSSGSFATLQRITAVGASALGYAQGATCVGTGAIVDTNNDFGTAIGCNAIVKGINAIQLGSGAGVSGAATNSDDNTFKVANNNGNFEIMSADGTIPTDRYTTTPSADGTYYPTLSISSGTPTRSWSTISALQNKSTQLSGMIINENSVISGLNKDATVGIGYGANIGMEHDVVIGYSASTSSNSGSGYNVAMGAGSYINGKRAVAIGGQAEATADHAIQIGSKNSATTNSDANTFKVANANGNFEMMDANGNLPAARLASITGLADGNYRLRLTISSGVPTLSWVAE